MHSIVQHFCKCPLQFWRQKKKCLHDLISCLKWAFLSRPESRRKRLAKLLKFLKNAFVLIRVELKEKPLGFFFIYFLLFPCPFLNCCDNNKKRKKLLEKMGQLVKKRMSGLNCRIFLSLFPLGAGIKTIE